MESYEMIGKIGEGTFGEVFKAKHVQTGKIVRARLGRVRSSTNSLLLACWPQVALKKIRIRHLEEGLPKNLLREIQALEKLQHPHVRCVYLCLH
jgi:serine/threonine protein kinase